MLARPDGVEHGRVVREHEQRQHERVAARHEHERRRERGREQERELRDPLERDVVLHVPPRQQHQRVRERGGLDEALEGDREDEPRGDGGGHQVVTRGRGAPRSTQASRRTRKSGATTNRFRSWIRWAKTDANAETTSTSQNVTESATARSAWSGASSERARAASTIVAATGTIAEVEVELGEVVEHERSTSTAS